MKIIHLIKNTVVASVVGGAIIVGLSAQAATIVWTNSTSGVWNTAANWNPNSVPSTNDTAIITNSGVTVSLNAATPVGAVILGTNGAGTVTLSLNSQTLSLYGPLTVNPSGSFTVDSGTLVGITNATLKGAVGWTGGSLAGTLVVGTNATLTLAGGGGNLVCYNCTVTNYGTVAWSSGYPDGGGTPGTTIYNYGLWDCQGDYILRDDGGGNNVVFNNYGTLRKSIGFSASQTAFLNGVLLNQLAGKVDLQTGNLVLEGTGNFTGGTATNNLGTLWFSSGYYTLNGTLTGTNVIENAAYLTGNNIINGGLNWQAGQWNGATSVTIATNSTVVMAGGNGNLYLYGVAVTNYGTVAWSSGYPDGGGTPGTTIYNYGLWDCQGDYILRDDGGGNNVVFNNYGTLRKSIGFSASQTAFLNGVLLNQLAGKVDLQTGNLVLEGTGNFTGGTATNNLGTLWFSSGYYTLNGTLTGTNVIENAAYLTGNNIINGGLNWQAGQWNGATSVTIATNSTVVMAGGNGNLYLYGVAVTNYGTVAWSSGYPDGGGTPGTTIYNYGLWDCQGDYILRDDGGGNNVVFDNYGTLRKSGGASELATATEFLGGVTFNQLAGVIDVQNGTNGLELALFGGGNLTGGYVTTNKFGLTVLASGAYNLDGLVTGTNTWQDGGSLIGTNVINGALTWVAGNWNNSTSVTITPTSTVLAVGTSTLDMNNTIVTNNGTFTWASGEIRAGNGTVVDNYGLWNCQSDQQFDYGDYGGAAVVFNNYGTLRKSGGASELAAATEFLNGVTFNQLAGVIDVQNGTNGLELALFGGGSLTGGYITTNKFGLTVLAQGSYNLNGTITGTNTWEDTGLLIGTTVINGGLTWVGGTWNGAPSVTISAGSTVIAVGPGNLDMNTTIVTNNGTFTWSNGFLRAGNGTAVYNYGLWNCQNDQQFNDNQYGGSSVFNNYGIFRKSGGGPEFTNSTIIGAGLLFNQLAGMIDVQTGTNGLQLDLQGYGNLSGGFITTNAEALTVLSQGNFNINGTVTSTNTWEDAGSLVGTNVIQGGLTWIGGNWNGATSVTITTNTTVIANGGAGNLDMSTTIVTNSGTFAWSDGFLRAGNGTTVYNYGLWNCENDQQFNANQYGGSSVFNNYGIFRKSGGGPEFTNSTIIGAGLLFNQLAGMIDVQNSTNGLQLDFQGGGNLTSGYITTNLFGLTVLSEGDFTINGTITGTNTWEDASPLFGTNVIRGGLTWIGGDWNNAPYVTIVSNATVFAAGGVNNLNLDSTIVTNNGTFVWVSGTFRSGGATEIINNGVWIAQSDEAFNAAYGAGAIFNNPGSFVKTAGVIGAPGTEIQNGVVFNNSGRLDAQAGDINLEGTYSLTNGTLNLGINNRTNYGEIGLAGAAPLVGSVSANLNNGYIPIEGNSFTNLYYGSYTGGFTNTTLPFADAWTTNYFPTYYVMTVLNSRPILTPLSTNTFVVKELTTLNVTNTATDLDIPAQTLVYSLAAGTNGMTVTGAPGVFNWSPQQTNSPSTNIVSVAVTDNGSPALSATNTFKVIVQEVNVPPSLPTISTQIVNELTLLTLTNSATNSNIHSTIAGYTLVSPPTGMVISPAGVITWTPTQTQSPATNLITTIVTNNNVYDQINPQLTATNTFTLIVREVNVPATLSVISTQIVNELTLLTVTNSATNSNIHSVISGYSLLNPPAGAAINASGIITWTPSQVESPATNLITTIVTNSNPYDLINPRLTTTNNFTVIVKEVNVPPTLPTISTQSVNELTLLTVTNTATNSNIHATITGYHLVSPLAGMGISAAGIFTWTPTQAQSPGTNLVTTVATNSNPYDLINPVLTATNTFTVVVKEVNGAPSLPTISTQIVNELTLLTVTNTATNSNVHASITGYALVSPLAGMSISAAGIFTWTPAQTESPGTNLVTTVVTNSNPYDTVNPVLTATNTFTVIVKEVNVPPTLPTVSTQIVNELTLLTVTNTATNSNIHATITGYHLVSPLAGMTISASGIFTWTPAQTESPGTNLVTTVVTNSNPYDAVNPVLTATNTFTVIVKEVNVPATLPTLSTQIVNELTLLTVTNTATNSNIHATITGYYLVNPLAGMAISAAGIITWTPAQTQSPGTNLITTVVTNNDVYDLVNPTLTATNTFTVVVKEVNVPATLPTISTQTVNELTLLTVTNTATNSNIHATITGYHLVSPLTGMTISAAGIFTWTPAQTESPGTNLVTTVVTNNNPYDAVNPILTATNNFTVIVKEVNVPPTLPTVSTQIVTLLQLFTFNNAATEPNIHSTNAGYALVAPPAGVAISGSGVITWTPTVSQSLSTNTVTTVVTNGNPFDAVNPRLTATNSFTVVVLPNLISTNITRSILNKTNLDLTWPSDHTGWRLEMQTNSLAIGLRTNWTAVAGSTVTNQVILTMNKTNGATFYRMIYP